MSELDDWFEYALDVPAASRAAAIASLRAQDPQLADRLQAMLDGLVTNPDFAATARPTANTTVPARILAVTLCVTDVPAAISWYEDVFHARCVQQDATSAVLAFANLELHLAIGDQTPPRVSVAHGDLRSLGQARTDADGKATLHLVDPWGNAFAVTDGS